MGQHTSASHTPCHIARPIRSKRPAPKYCETNVLVNIVSHSGKHIAANHAVDAANAADTASPDSHFRKNRSMNVITIHDELDTNSGNATTSTSRPPAGRLHQLLGASSCRSRTSSMARYFLGSR